MPWSRVHRGTCSRSRPTGSTSPASNRSSTRLAERRRGSRPQSSGRRWRSGAALLWPTSPLRSSPRQRWRAWRSCGSSPSRSASRPSSRSAGTPSSCRDLEALTTEHPYRERPHGQLMLALYRSARQADALEHFQEVRRLLDQELGLEPGERLKALQKAILAHDGSLEVPAQAVRAVHKNTVLVALDASGDVESLLTLARPLVQSEPARELVIAAGRRGRPALRRNRGARRARLRGSSRKASPRAPPRSPRSPSDVMSLGWRRCTRRTSSLPGWASPSTARPPGCSRRRRATSRCSPRAALGPGRSSFPSALPNTTGRRSSSARGSPARPASRFG